MLTQVQYDLIIKPFVDYESKILTKPILPESLQFSEELDQQDFQQAFDEFFDQFTQEDDQIYADYIEFSQLYQEKINSHDSWTPVSTNYTKTPFPEMPTYPFDFADEIINVTDRLQDEIIYDIKLKEYEDFIPLNQKPVIPSFSACNMLRGTSFTQKTMEQFLNDFIQQAKEYDKSSYNELKFFELYNQDAGLPAFFRLYTNIPNPLKYFNDLKTNINACYDFVKQLHAENLIYQSQQIKQKQLNDTIVLGKKARDCCNEVLNYIGGTNTDRLTTEQILQMEQVFATPDLLLSKGMARSAKQAIQTLSPDGILVTQDMVNDIVDIFNRYDI